MVFETFLKYSLEGIAFLLVSIILFNQFSQLLQTLGLFTTESMSHVGFISALLAFDNLLTQRFFNLRLIN